MFKKITMVMAAALLVFSGAANAEKVYKLKLAASWGPTLHPFIDTSLEMAELAEKLSNGRLKITVDAANKHKSPLGILDLVKAGQYDLGHTASYYYKGKDINAQAFTTMPFGFTAVEQYGWFYYGGGMELMQKAYDKHKILAFPGGNSGMQMGGWFKKEINSIDDFKGLKMRIPGFAGEVLAKAGAVVTNIAPGEMYTALDRGTIDALEWVGPSMDIKMGFHKIAPYYYTGWHEPGAELVYFVNKKKFNKLPQDLQTVLTTAMRLSAYDTYIKNQHLNAENWAKMKTDYPNIKVKTFPKPVFDALRKINAELVSELATKTPLMKEVLESQKKYQEKARVWSKMSDYLYLNDN
ncbi:MAG: ABC transporter substrate-binding protein [Deltaproteobacteria bacterium]|nr:MAG: ABC transporter substrate-binding protein [Gammaproteobacteria bacterium]PIE74374.1 MAG: ABC transporter substrate-binding protein [Deltaproteobacteria bacterium]